jgi:hypothetical protein
MTEKITDYLNIDWFKFHFHVKDETSGLTYVEHTNYTSPELYCENCSEWSPFNDWSIKEIPCDDGNDNCWHMAVFCPKCNRIDTDMMREDCTDLWIRESH